jgi:5-methylcytosine-specific restriction endonuclease McrA
MRDLIFALIFGLGAVILYYLITRPESVKPTAVPQSFRVPTLTHLAPPTRIAYQRIPLTNRQRFEILKRDGFTCQYCGRKPPEVVLEVDHIFPVDKGGTNDPSNLVASCYDCNRGKSDKLLDSSFQKNAVTSEVTIR